MKMLKILATLALSLVPFAAFAANGDCDGDDATASLICPSTMTDAAGGGCVFSG